MKILAVLFFSCFICINTSNSFSLSSDANEKKAPLEINAEKGMVCSLNKKQCIAFGPVVTTKGTFVLKCQKLIAHFKNKTQDIKKIEALDRVRFFSTKGGFSGTANYALYTPEKGQLILQGNPILKDPKTTIFVGSKIIFYEASQMATALGRSTIRHGDKLMQADVLRVYFTKDGDGKLLFDRMEAEGNVIISTPTEIAKSKRGSYNTKTQVAELFDNVIITKEDGQLRGNYGRYDMTSGLSQIFSSHGNMHSKQQVQAILTPRKKK